MNRRQFLQWVVAGGLAGFAGMWGRAASGSGEGVVLGMNSHILEARWLDHVAALGLRDVRFTIYWPTWKEDASYRRSLDMQIEQLHGRGMRLLVVVHNWAGGEVFHTGVDREMWDRFADWVASLAERYPRVEGWQLWNEQEVWVQTPFGAGTNPRRPAEETGRNYGEQLALAYPRIRQANGEALVVTGGMAASGAGGRWEGFLRGMMETDPPFDAAAIHVYGLWDRVRERLERARELVGPGRPIWLTEFGMDQMGDDFSESRHLETWRTTIEGNMSEGLAERMYAYCLQTDGRYPDHGLFRPGGEGVRPTYEWLKGYMDEGA